MNDGGLDNKRVALVYMPWGSTRRPSMALGILKKCAAQAGFAADAHYLNVRFAESIGFDLYEMVSGRSAIHPEWFFSARLFGKDGLGLMNNSWFDMQSSPGGRAMADKILDLAGGSTETCLKILDVVPEFIESCESQIDWEQYTAVGFSVTFAQTMSSLLLARRLKQRHPELRIVFGGANVDSEMGFELLRSCEWIDYVVHGEAERSFPRLLASIEAGAPFELPGVSMRRGESVIPGFTGAEPLADMNESPTPDYSDYFREVEIHRLDRRVHISLPIESSRGCWWGAKHHCTFCGLNGETMSFRKKSADRVYDDILSLSNRHRCLSFDAVDNIMDMGYFRDLLPRLAGANIDLSFFYEVKANLSREQVRMLAAAGVTSIQPGIESFSSELLRLMRKGITAIQNIQFLKWCYEFGIDPLWNILYAFPGESRQHYEDHPRLLRLLFHLRPPAGVFPVIFERFSPYHTDPGGFRLKIEPSSEYRMLYPERHVDLRRIAYYFEGSWEGQTESPDDYIQPVVDAQEKWMSHWREKRILFHYEKGPGFLTLHDNRPLQTNEVAMRRLTLNEVQSRIYLYCDENRSFNAIRKKLLDEFEAPITEEQTQRLLDQFVERGLMFREGNRYLSLAVRKSSGRNQTEKGFAEHVRDAEMVTPAQDVVGKNQNLPILSAGANPRTLA